ncbi:hypothetical protein GCM10022268_19620 [Sphingomonas cynarae]|uniref:Uncharacterized protein n=1 Tax=Sphingomonas cynarae TaxID=930197 RepID=A0ABP7DV45_9SPHN
MLIPESVAAYVHDGGIRRAVKELIGLNPDEILDGMAWGELARFYRAQLATRQLEAEWGVFALEAWDAVWGGLLDHWKSLSPDEQMVAEADVGVNLASLSDTDDNSLWFGRLFTSRNFTFYASLAAVPESGLRLKVSCDRNERSVGFADLAAVLDDVGNWTPSLALPLDGGEIDPSSLREIAARAVGIADEATAPRRKART